MWGEEHCVEIAKINAGPHGPASAKIGQKPLSNFLLCLFACSFAALLLTGTMPFYKDSSLPFKFDAFTASAICIALGAAVGAVQGYFVAYYKIPAFIVTLAGMLYFRGFSMIVTNGATIASLPRPLTRFATASLASIVLTFRFMRISRKLAKRSSRLHS
jgi:ABC-type xylose transport system permease subunit